ncbi:uncharacterized protein [Antedon mediterranea]|uniref:uncharacterized protein n=1 Tax=Antedon mediterranea TaxID=105859 RepID=UPI003AF796F8
MGIMKTHWKTPLFFLFIVPATVSSTVRLVGGGNSYEGRVEVYNGGEWGTICDDYWDIKDARVVCRQLGFGDATGAPLQAQFGQGLGPIMYDDVQCTGYETDIRRCSNNGFKVHNCGHSEDAGVICDGPGDLENPTLRNCPNNQIVEAQGKYQEVSWTEPIAHDNKGIQTEEKTYSVPRQRFELVGGKKTVYTVRYWVEDYSGNEAECIFNITIIDDEPPELQCPDVTSNYHRTYYGYIHAHTDAGSPNGTITWVPLVARDNSGIPPNITSYPNKPGDVYPMRMFPPYTTTVRATDQSGNFEECVLHFAVVDIENPVLHCPAHSNNMVKRTSESSWSVFTDVSSRSARLYWPQPNVTDNSGTVVSISSNYNSGDEFPAGSSAYEITYTAIDRDNNVGNCSFYIAVEDWESPSVECLPDLERYTDDGSRFALFFWNITLNDNFAVSYCMSNDSRVEPTKTTLNGENITLAQHGFFPIGVTEVEYTVTDTSGNNGTCLLTITVIDNERPSIICPSNFSNYYDYIFGFHRLVTDYGHPYATVTWYPPDVDDNSQDLVTWESFPYTSGDKIPMRQFPPYTVQMTATDLFGNNKSCYIYFTVIDIEPPIIECPTNITNYYDTYFGIVRAATDSDANMSSVVTWEDPTVFDNSGGRLIMKSSHKSGDVFVPKFYPPYEVEFTAEDASGNVNSCKLYFLVTGKLYLNGSI